MNRDDLLLIYKVLKEHLQDNYEVKDHRSVVAGIKGRASKWGPVSFEIKGVKFKAIFSRSTADGSIAIGSIAISFFMDRSVTLKMDVPRASADMFKTKEILKRVLEKYPTVKVEDPYEWELKDSPFLEGDTPF